MSWGWLMRLIDRRKHSPPVIVDIDLQHERLSRDEARINELAARQRRVIRENHLAPDIMRALKGPT